MGWTPLVEACYQGSGDVARLLVDSGADINVRDHAGKTALHFAKWRGLSGVARLLKRKGATE
jgi:hypothetical protein